MKYLAIDCETTGLSTYHGHKPFAISLYAKEIGSKYIEFAVDLNGKVDTDCILRNSDLTWLELVTYCTDPTIEKIFHNRKFDQHHLEAIGIPLKGKLHDTFIAARCCNTLEPDYELKPLAKKYCNISDEDEKALRSAIIKCRDLAKKKKIAIPNAIGECYFLPGAMGYWRKIKKNLCEIYCRKDTERTYKLWEFYLEGMKELGVRRTYDFEIKLMDVVYEMECRGVRVNDEKLQDLIYEYKSKITETETEIKQMVNKPLLNINSGPQLQKLFSELNIIQHINKRTDSGGVSTDAQALLEIKDKHPVVSKLIEYRGYDTGLGYYLDYDRCKVPDVFKTANDLLDWNQYAIHASFNQFGAKTGRFSCSNPNLLNVANPETSSGQNVANGRCIFGPRQGYIWLAADYSQIELRIFANNAKEERLITAFQDGRDPHNETREAIPFLASKPKDIGRKLAKNTNFTVINCGGAAVLQKKYGIPLNEGKPMIEGFYKAYPSSKDRQKEAAKFAEVTGYIINSFNRKVHVDPNYSYRATSYDIQSSALDLIKLALQRCYDFIKREHLDIWILMCIHDEIVFEVNEKTPVEVYFELKEIMEDHLGVFRLPTPVELSIIRESWDKKEKIK